MISFRWHFRSSGFLKDLDFLSIVLKTVVGAIEREVRVSLAVGSLSKVIRFFIFFLSGNQTKGVHVVLMKPISVPTIEFGGKISTLF